MLQKPENMCIGAGNQRDSLFLIDYGMAKAYRNADGTHIDKPSDKAMCVGTQAFMSRRCQTSRRDDIESWFYVISYLYHGRLPWSTHAQKFEESFARSGQKWTKESITLNTDIQQQKEALFASGGANLDLPSELHLVLRHISGLSFIAKPDYRYLANALQSWRRTGRHQEKKVCLMHNHNNSPRATPGWKRKGYFDE
ncbi:hypothetical protein HD553DRAFT_151157 [Filobasidium floriforme]|uniref:uncharacterized protein n=1 Tax=Filobasidium floriforme TaxID=5210 RepID=UPI001E8D3470|nr:uncharacterized protein HD553DRAFT_151157 [Filobasidium floriforme]KAH8077953.1 hypothetical protein HD553DRAFT_151157 [Filobasidium floriforme]